MAMSILKEDGSVMSVGMVDLHCHILPGMDHGSASWDESMAMARIAAAEGIAVTAATPHVNFEYRPEAEEIRDKVDEFNRRLAEEKISMQVVAGGDYHLTPELTARMDSIVTLGNNGRYFLLEFSFLSLPPAIQDVLKRFLDRGFTPIITHPERMIYLQKRPDLVEDMAEIGCPIQITAGSFTGLFGSQVQAAAMNLLNRGLCHVVASDAHWIDLRPPRLSSCRAVLEKLLPMENVLALLRENPLRILQGHDLPLL